MDVNGFTYLVQKAAHSQCPDHEAPHEILILTLSSLQKAFSNHAYWNDINNENSDLCKFILAVCQPDESDLKYCDHHGVGEEPEERDPYDSGVVTLDKPKDEKEDAPKDLTPTGTSTPGDTPKPKEHLLSVFRLNILGILWCMGDEIEKAQELYLTMAPGGKEGIGCATKLFKKNIKTLVEFSTDIALDYEAKSTGVARTRNITAA